MMEKLKVAEPISGFTERDPSSKAILNTDMSSYIKYKIQKRKHSEINRKTESITEIRGEIDDLKGDLQEIKSLLMSIMHKEK